jgi:hypothetical protein
MYPAEIVVGKLNGVRCFQVVPLLAKHVGQAGKFSHVHPKREILALKV